MTSNYRLSTIKRLDTRNDLHLTTTGACHAHRPTAPFPTDKLKCVSSLPLPARLSGPPLAQETYASTTHAAHDYKTASMNDDIARHMKSQPLKRVHYNLPMIMKLNGKLGRPALTMANQCSEMVDKYRGRQDQLVDVLPRTDLTDTTFRDHCNNGPTKNMKASTTIPRLCGEAFNPQEEAILHRRQPYLTTNKWHHRPFTRDEQINSYANRDIATYWQCEDYPKAWGFGTKHNPLANRRTTHQEPMRDRTVFKTGTTVPQLPKRPDPMTDGLKTIFGTSYTEPSTHKRQKLFSKPVEPLFTETVKDVSLMEAVPNMYKTVNHGYGNGPVHVL